MTILGVDEVGRGPLAGPLVVGAVILPEERAEWIEELKDSKKLSAKKREELNLVILDKALAVGVGFVSAAELDRVGVSEGLRLATRRAVKSVQAKRVRFSQIVIDGKVNFLARTNLERFTTTLIKADDKIKEVSAASIVAKVARDRYMREVAKEYTVYGFDKNVGYGTAGHLEAINKYGICEEHRKSFEPIKSLVGFNREDDNFKKNTTKMGNFGEEAVCEYLVRLGHEIIMRNFKTRLYEIDIISTRNDKIYFTEVKYRKTGYAGGGVAAINRDKLKRMQFSAESFLRYFGTEKEPVLAVADVTGDDFTVADWFLLSWDDLVRY
ncbi:MAG: ribonuclease HII [Candidatus Saccharibacteria bacterium]|nr:ribonuclease HII [Candidatus Saccharibacteria bacterium]